MFCIKECKNKEVLLKTLMNSIVLVVQPTKYRIL